MLKDKAFKYVPPVQEKKGNNEQQKVKKGGRIRVQAGDKCVPPAKSKPKKRKTVGPQNESALNMDCVQWSDHTYSVKTLMNSFSDKFPLLLKITKGYFGKLGEELSIGQVLQVHSCSLQKRILAIDSGKRNLSIPIDYPVDVTILEAHDRVWMRLRDIVLSRKLPIKVRVVNMTKSTSGEDLVNIVGEDLTINEVLEDVYLKGNPIVNGWIDQVDISMVPSFLQCQFAVAVGMRGATAEEWIDYQGMYSRSIRHLNFSLMKGYTGIFVNGDVPYPLLSDYKDVEKKATKKDDFILNNSIITTSNNRGESVSELNPEEIRLYENLPTDERRKTTNTYNNPSYSHDEDTPTVMSNFVIPHFANAKDPYYNKTDDDKIEVKPDLHNPPISRCETPFSEIDENDVESMFDNVIRVGQETLEKQQADEFERKEHEQMLERERKEHEQMLERERIAQKALYERQQKEAANRYSKSNKSDKRQSGKKKVKDTHDEQYTSHIEVNSSVLRHSASLKEYDNNKNVQLQYALNNKRDSNSNPDLNTYYQSSNNTRKSSSSSGAGVGRSGSQSKQQQQRGSYVCETSSGTPMGVIQPLVLQKRKETTLSEPITQSKITSMEDVPQDMTSLTVDDVSMCLKLLNMEIHITEFRNHQIDGKLLSDMRENVLSQEFHFTPFNASKLMRFVRGWRPKFT